MDVTPQIQFRIKSVIFFLGHTLPILGVPIRIAKQKLKIKETCYSHHKGKTLRTNSLQQTSKELQSPSLGFKQKIGYFLVTMGQDKQITMIRDGLIPQTKQKPWPRPIIDMSSPCYTPESPQKVPDSAKVCTTSGGATNKCNHLI